MSKFHYVVVKVKDVTDGKVTSITENVLVEGAVSVSDAEARVIEGILETYGLGIEFEVRSVQPSQVTMLLLKQEEVQ